MGHLIINPEIGNVLEECIGEKHGKKILTEVQTNI